MRGATLPLPLPLRVPVALGLTQVVHWGSLFYGFSVLMPALLAETGWRRDMVVGAFSAGLLAEAGAAVLTGLLLDRLGARRVMVAGSLLAGLGMWLAGRVQTPWQLYAAWIFIGATMAATLYQAAFAAVTAAYGEAARRGIALVAFAGGLASTIFWPLTGYLVGELGWRATCTVLAVLNAACALPHLLMPGPRRPGPAPAGAGDGAEGGMVLGWRFAALLFVYAVIGIATAGIAVHLVPFLQERGLGASAAFLAGLIGIAQVAGRVAEFAGGGRLSLPALAQLALGGVGLACLLLAAGQGAWPLGLALLLYGAANGVLTIVRGALPIHVFGTARYGTISGLLSAGSALARAAGPLAMAWAWERSGGYGAGLAGLALLYLLAMPVLAAATRRGGAG